MSIAAKRRETEVFSLAFLDCICCGFGAVLLVFILTISQKTAQDKDAVEDVQARAAQVKRDVTSAQEDLDRLSQALAAAQLELESIDSKNNQDQLKLTQRQKELLLMLQQTGSMKDALASLLGEKKALPTEDQAPLPIPNIDRSQYLTGFKLQGDYIVFLVRVSGSMLDDTIDTASARLEDPDAKKLEAPKWQRTIRALEWMIATLDPDTHFQIHFFNEETFPILPERPDQWYSTKDKELIGQIVKKLHTIVPHGSANLERAITTMRYLEHLPTNLVLFTDGLPTKSDSVLSEGDVGEEQRIRFFKVAMAQLPPRIPVSTILFPMNGDPAAPALYWELANATRGALVSPSKAWPDS
jgi:hypothetical protein